MPEIANRIATADPAQRDLAAAASFDVSVDGLVRDDIAGMRAARGKPRVMPDTSDIS